MNKRSSLWRIDEQVFLTMGALCLLCLVILGFRYATKTTCNPIQIIMNTGSAPVNTTVTIRAEVKGAKSFVWDMGDGTAVSETSAMVAHIYKKPGRYTIKVLVNDACEEFRDIVITEMPQSITTYRLPTFICRDTAYVNKAITFEDTSSAATSWEWRFEDGGSPEGNKQKVQHTYYYAGRKLVTVKLNGRADMVTYKYIDVIDPSAKRSDMPVAPKPTKPGGGEGKIVVIPSKPDAQPIHPEEQPHAAEKPAEAPKAKPKVANVSTEELSNMLRGINEGHNTEGDISGFFCNPNMSVVYDGKMMLFSQACQELKQVKKNKIKRIEVSCSKDSETNCINGMQIVVKKKLLPL